MVNTVIIGRGNISNELANNLPEDWSLNVIGVREKRLTNNDIEVLNIIKKSDMIVYLGYDHRNLFVNLNVLYKTLKYLSLAKWGGLFVFVNTQAALDHKIYRRINPIPNFFNQDIYRFTKRIQSRILVLFNAKISISEIYLPVVVGKGTKIEDRYEKIAMHKDINMLNRGENKIALLEMNNFSKWFWATSIDCVLNRIENLPRKIFLYDNVKSESGLINEFRNKYNLQNMEIKNYKLKYWYSNNFFRNLSWMIKRSPFGLLLYLIVGLMRRDISTTINKKNGLDGEAIKFDNNIFIPNDIECMSSVTEVMIDKIEFKTLKIKNDR